ncbi:hypothetical protein PLESTF_001783200 [Pleodorina starrii]|nr:hypothetical protein PLESTF_001783200 [Pleodorina starrii]
MLLPLIVDVLWKEYPPAEPDSEEEQLEEEMAVAATLPPAGGAGGSGRGGGRGRGGRGAAAAAAAAAVALGPHDILFGDNLVVPVAGADGAGAATGRGRGRGRGRGGTGRGRRRGKQIDPDSDDSGGEGGLAALAAVNLNTAGTQGFALGAAGGALALGVGAAAAAGGGAYGGVSYGGGGGLSQAGLGLDAGGVQGVVVAQPRKRARRQSDEGAGPRERSYAPNPGTANYAFLIVMYMTWKREKRRQWDKEELMSAAQASGLAAQDIHGTKDMSAPGKVSNFYCGWSCFRQMISRDPPLASERTKAKGARGKEYSLTNMGWALAARLYKSALRYREVQALPGVSEEQVDEDIRRYCEVEEAEPLLQAYPAGTPTRTARGRAYKGFEPGPRQDRDGGAAAAAAALPVGGLTAAPPAAGAAAPAPARARAPSRPRQRRTSGLSQGDDLDVLGSGYGGDDGCEDVLGSQDQGGRMGSHGLGMGSQGSLGMGMGMGANGLAAMQGLAPGAWQGAPAAAALTGGGGVPAALTGFARPGLNLADVFTCAGQAFDSGVRATTAGTGAGARGAAPPPTSGVRHCTGTDAGGGAGGRAQAAAAAAAAAAELRAAAAVTAAARQRQPPTRAAAPVTRELDVVELLDSSDDDGGDGGGNGGGGAGGAGAPAHGSDPHLDTSFAFTLRGAGAGNSSQESLGVGKGLAAQRGSQEAQPSQLLMQSASQALAGSGVGAAAAAAPQPQPPAAAAAAAAARAKRPRRPAVNEADVEQLVAMGFDQAMARKALRREGGDLSSALDRLDEGTISPGEEHDSEPEAEAAGAGAWEGAAGPEEEVTELLPSLAQRLRGDPPGRSPPAHGGLAGAQLLPGLEVAEVGRDVGGGAGLAAAAAAAGAATRPRAKATKKAAAGAGAAAGAAAAAEPPVPALARVGSGPGPFGGSSQPLYGMGSQQQHGLGSQQQYDASASQQPYRVGSGSQQLDVYGSQQQAGGSGNQDPEAGEGSDERTLCTYEWMLPRVSEVTTNHRALHVRLPPLQPGQRFEDVYDVVLLADNREPASLVESLRAQAAAQGVRLVAGLSLTVGDFLWVAARRGAPLSQAGKEHWFVMDAVLERKRTEDLLSSVKDGRYAQQKYRLKRCGLRRLYYLLEEPIDQRRHQGLDEKVLRTSIQSGLLEGFTVLRTDNGDDTARQLCMLTRALERQCRGRTSAAAAAGAAAADGEEVLPSYTTWDAGLKNLKQNMKVQAMFGLMLCAVPGFGEERAKSVLARYSTPAHLWDGYKAAMRVAAAAGRDPTAAAEQMLAGEVGAQCSARLYQMLFSKGVDLQQVLAGR